MHTFSTIFVSGVVKMLTELSSYSQELEDSKKSTTLISHISNFIARFGLASFIVVVMVLAMVTGRFDRGLMGVWAGSILFAAAYPLVADMLAVRKSLIKLNSHIVALTERNTDALGDILARIEELSEDTAFSAPELAYLLPVFIESMEWETSRVILSYSYINDLSFDINSRVMDILLPIYQKRAEELASKTPHFTSNKIFSACAPALKDILTEFSKLNPAIRYGRDLNKIIQSAFSNVLAQLVEHITGKY